MDSAGTTARYGRASSFSDIHAIDQGNSQVQLL
jgi:hypothetical protein